MGPAGRQSSLARSGGCHGTTTASGARRGGSTWSEPKVATAPCQGLPSLSWVIAPAWSSVHR